MVRAVALALLTGCNSLLGVHGFTLDAAADDIDATDATDAPIDPTSDAPHDGIVATDGTTCMNTRLFGNICTPFAPAFTLTTIIDTTTCAGGTVVLQTVGPAVCMFTANHIQVSDSAQIVGSHPLALVAHDQLIVGTGARLDGASHANQSGPGADDPSCVVEDAVDLVGGGGGGAGGAFQGDGGPGGAGTGQSGTPRGVRVATPDHLRGGCRGGTGSCSPPVPGAHGGGAIYLVAGMAIEIDGDVDASGQGGAGNPSQCGGSGGGSGGMIALEAPVVHVSGRVWADGGGGAGGSGSSSPAPGADPAGAGPAPGSAGTSGGLGSAGGQGGDGTFANELAGGAGLDAAAGVIGQCGGGGGGGGAGFVLAFSAGLTVGGTVSPTALVVP